MTRIPGPPATHHQPGGCGHVRAYGMLFWNNPMPDGSDPKTAITQALSAATSSTTLSKAKAACLMAGCQN